MWALTNGKLRPLAVDYHLRASGVRVRVRRIATVRKVDGLYFVRPHDPRLIWNYVRKIGLREVIRKVVSRLSEESRNAKHVSVGFGEVVECGANCAIPVGSSVLFVAPCHPLFAERIVLAQSLVRLAPDTGEDDGTIRIAAFSGSQPSSLDCVAGWDPESGVPIRVGDEVFEDARRILASIDWRTARALDVPRSDVTERTTPAASASRPTAVVFGYGNYAKTVIVPSIRPAFDVTCVHEIDPTQLPAEPAWAIDSSPTWRGDERYAAAFVAGFHHTHVDVAIGALQRGGYAVVEKPLATSAADLDRLMAAARDNQRVFVCYQKRYQSFNAYIREDLGLDAHAPISCHCLVYEVPLPALHWYRWPSSRSRVVSNGCHWIDYFLYLNDFAAPTRLEITTTGAHETVHCLIELANGAEFSMVLTDRGSERVGVQDHIELRSSDATVRIINGHQYEAENRHRVIRRISTGAMTSLRDMYRVIGAKIVRGEPGDSLQSLEVSARTVLQLEHRMEASLRKADQPPQPLVSVISH